MIARVQAAQKSKVHEGAHNIQIWNIEFCRSVVQKSGKHSILTKQARYLFEKNGNWMVDIWMALMRLTQLVWSTEIQI